jgi:hypothetical protein
MFVALLDIPIGKISERAQRVIDRAASASSCLSARSGTARSISI